MVENHWPIAMLLPPTPSSYLRGFEVFGPEWELFAGAIDSARVVDGSSHYNHHYRHHHYHQHRHQRVIIIPEFSVGAANDALSLLLISIRPPLSPSSDPHLPNFTF